MSGRYFLDTNILVYTLDPTTEKLPVSQKLLASAIQTGNGMISTQVVQEFLSLATGKFKVTIKAENTIEFFQKILIPLCQVFTDIDLFLEAMEIQMETKYSFYDSLIIAAALRGGCDVLYTEDMRSGQKVRGLEIINPYLPGIKLPQ